MSEDVAARLPDFDEDATVRDDDGQTGDEESESEEELLGRLAILGQDRTRKSGFFEAQIAPHSQQRRRHHQETEQPRTDDHCDDVAFAVDLVVPRRRGDQYVPVELIIKEINEISSRLRHFHGGGVHRSCHNHNVE